MVYDAGVHDASSRSHAILRVFIERPDGDTTGVLTLIDLAGEKRCGCDSISS